MVVILLDSSGWLEIFTDGPLSKEFENYLKDPWLVSTVNIFEVYRKIARTSEDKALQAVALMERGEVVPVDETLALEAADLSIEYELGMADSLILATARYHKAVLITKDNDFRDIPDCRVISPH